MRKYFFTLITGLLVTCSAPANKKTESVSKAKEKELSAGYLIAIAEVDNSVRIYVEDSLIFNSGTIHSSPEVDYQIDLTPYISTGNEEVRIELYNGVEPYNPQIDPRWEIRYDLIINGEIMDFVHEFGDDNQIGKAYETTYIINEWIAGKNN